jgi:hypothetical protein
LFAEAWACLVLANRLTVFGVNDDEVKVITIQTIPMAARAAKAAGPSESRPIHARNQSPLRRHRFKEVLPCLFGS